MAGKKNLSGIVLDFGANTQPLQKALQEVNTKSKDLQSELKQVDRLLKFNPQNTELLRQKQQLLADSINNSKDKLNQLKQVQSQVEQQFKSGQIGEEQYRAFQREVVKTTSELKALEQQAKQSNNTFKNISENVGKFGDSKTALGKKLLPLSAAVGAIGVASGKMALDFTDSMAKVSTIADETQVPLKDLEKSILDLSNSSGISADEIANNVYDAISAGQSTADAVDFVTNSTKLAKAGFAEAGQSLDVLTTILNAYGMESSEVNKVSDMLIQTQNKGKVTVGQLSSVMGKIIPTANATGVSLEQLTAGYAIMTSKGIAAAETTTYMNSMFNELSKSGSKADLELRKLSGKSFTELMQSGASVADVLTMLDKSAKSNKKSLQDMFGSAEAGKAALTLLSDGADAFNKSVIDMKNSTGATETAFKKLQTPAEDMRKTVNELKNTAISLGTTMLQTFMPVISQITGKIRELTSSFNNMDEGTKQLIVTVIAITASLAPLLIIIGKIATGISALMTFISPTGLIIIGIVALIGTIKVLSDVIYANNRANEEAARTVSYTKQETDKFTKSIEDQAKSWETLKQRRDEKLQGDLAEISNTQAMIRELQSYVDESGKINEKKERAIWLVEQINAVMPNSIKLVDEEKVAWQMSSQEMENYFEKKRAMVIQQANEEAYTTAIKNRSQAEQEASQAYIDMANQEERMRQAYEERERASIGVMSVFKEVAYKKELEIFEKKKATYDTADATLNDYYSTIHKYEENDIAIKSNNWEKIAEISKGVVDTFKTAKDNTTDILRKQVAETGIQYGLLQMKVEQGVKGVTKEMVDEAGVNYQKAIEEYKKVGGAIPDGMQIGIENGKPMLRNKVVGFLTSIKSWFTSKDTGFDTHSPSKWAEQLMRWVTEGMIIGLNNGKGEVMDNVDKLTAELKDRVSSAINNINKEYDNISLKYDLWEKSYGVNASEQEKLAKKSELLVNQMDAQENKVLVLETQYKSIAEQYGEQHELSVQASNDLLKEQIAMADLTNQLIELQKTKARIAEANIKANEDAKNAYDRYIYQNGASLREQGVSQEEIEIAASRVSGYNSSLSNSVNAVGSYFDNLMGKLSGKTSLLSDIPNLNYVADGGSSGGYNNNVYNNANTNKTEHIYNFAGANFEFKVDDTFNPNEFLRELKSVVKVNGG